MCEQVELYNGHAAASSNAQNNSANSSRFAKTPALQLLSLIDFRYRAGLDEHGRPFVVRLDTPNIARDLRDEAFLVELRHDYFYCIGRGQPVQQVALDGALDALHGRLLRQAIPREELWLRVARCADGKIAVDLGREDGRIATVGPDGWTLDEKPKVVFRRTVLTGELPTPVQVDDYGGCLERLRSLLNVPVADWPLMLAWLVASFIPDMPHPVLILGSVQGSGKTTLFRMLCGLVDPSPAPAPFPAGLASPPRDMDGWIAMASNAYLIFVDNVSRLSEWWSDAICRAVTGDSPITRKKYTDNAAFATSFRRPVGLTSIDPGALRADLMDRALLIELEPIKETDRREEAELWQQYHAARPEILGALLTLLSAVLNRLPHVKLEKKPRMADFARVVAALDDVIGANAAALYLGQKRGDVLSRVLEDDPIAAAVLRLMPPGAKPKEGTMAELLQRLTPIPNPTNWPKDPSVLRRRLKYLSPALEHVGIGVTPPGKAGGLRVVRLFRLDGDKDATAEPFISEHFKRAAAA